MKFYKCETCGKIIVVLKESACATVCCGKDMKELVLGEVDAALEKHVPEVEIADVMTVKVGSVAHPMLAEHFINFIAVETDRGYQIRNLTPDDTPETKFAFAPGETPKAVYEYCNLHGLWKKEL